ncbi:MAG: desulfoferrodoxin family protein [Elusimicrobia bacterium]|nr:desulfoferrodoxin family protein [Elusimicrobiota bacterium]
MKASICKVCGYVAIDGVVPEVCPVCHAPKTAFVDKTDMKTAQDIAVKGESEKKHIPFFLVVKECGLIPHAGCTDVHVKIGEITHPMTVEHSIVSIDLYIDKKWVARSSFTPDKINAATVLHIKVPSGTVTAVAHCNLHGWWLNETAF